MNVEYTGWLLDVYTDRKEGGIVLWFLGDQGERLFLRQPFPVVMYAAGDFSRLRALWHYLEKQPMQVSLERTERRSLFDPDMLTVMKIQVKKAFEQPRLFARIKQYFPELDYYDADIPIFPRFSAKYNVFPLTRCRVVTGTNGWIQEITPLGSRWDLDSEPPPLRILTIEPDIDPSHAQPAKLEIRYGRYHCRWEMKPEKPLLLCLESILRRYDPDLILTNWGDTWLISRLLEYSRQLNIPLSLNRDPDCEVIYKAQRSYYTYGTVVHRGQQIHLIGRWHIDALNAMMFGDYGLEGVFELARVSALPVQVAARNSPGSGITAMQNITALRKEILVPYHKQQTERYKTAFDLIGIDKGGLVYQPLIGLFPDVAEIDFISMYPSIMRRHNISPETVGNQHLNAQFVRDLGLFVNQDQPGLVPETLAPLLDKRITLKQRLLELHPWDCRYKPYKAQSAALKWLLVVCFGYTGYKNAKFGKIEAHEAITAYAREVLLRAKEAAEVLGFTVLHMYVDGLWIQKPGACNVADFQPVLDEILERTGLPIALDGIYKWVAFLPSRQDNRVPVANRYFGVFQNGEIKIRGIEARREDTPQFIVQTQMEILKLLSKAPTADSLPSLLPDITQLLRRRLDEIQKGSLNIEQFLVRQKLSQALNEYRVPSPAARAAKQLEAEGKLIHIGQHVRLLYVRGEQRVIAWDLSLPPDPATLDVIRYKRDLLRAASTLLGPLGVNEDTLRNWLFSNASYAAPPGILPKTNPNCRYFDVSSG